MTRTRTAFLAVFFATPLIARATPNFPEAIKQDLGLAAAPPCTICHATNEGGQGTVVKPFGKYLVSRGLAPFDESSLAGSLAAADGERHDSDGDGITDIQALKQGLDPKGSSTGPQIEYPTFGCNVTGDGPGDTFLFGLVLALRLAAGRLCRLRGIRAGVEQTEGGTDALRG
jgi:hypothetical protein